ncbi:MAG: GNAT family protein [Solirubrobacteraceae bacterium]
MHGSTLTLRLPEAADAPALLDLASDPDVTRWFSWGPYTTVDEPLAYVERLGAQRERGDQLDLLIVHRDKGPAGIVGLGEHSLRDRRAMVGTWLGRRFWGTGVNREVKALIFRLAFETLGVERLGAYSNPANERATRGLLGVGFRHEGVLRRWHRHGDTAYDVNVFGLLREEWAAGPLAKLPAAVEGEPPPAFVSRASAPS